MGFFDSLTKTTRQYSSTRKVAQPSRADMLKAEYRKRTTEELSEILKNDMRNGSKNYATNRFIMEVLEERGLGLDYISDLSFEAQQDMEIKSSIDDSALPRDKQGTIDPTTSMGFLDELSNAVANKEEELLKRFKRECRNHTSDALRAKREHMMSSGADYRVIEIIERELDRRGEYY